MRRPSRTMDTGRNHPDKYEDLSAGLLQELLEFTIYRVTMPDGGDRWKIAAQVSARSEKTGALTTVTNDWATASTLDDAFAKMNMTPGEEVLELF